MFEIATRCHNLQWVLFPELGFLGVVLSEAEAVGNCWKTLLTWVALSDLKFVKCWISLSLMYYKYSSSSRAVPHDQIDSPEIAEGKLWQYWIKKGIYLALWSKSHPRPTVKILLVRSRTNYNTTFRLMSRSDSELFRQKIDVLIGIFSKLFPLLVKPILVQGDVTIPLTKLSGAYSGSY